MSGRKSQKNQRLGSSRRGPKGLNRNIEKGDDDDNGFQQIAESEDGRNEFHTTSDYHATQFDHPPSSSIDQQTSALECPPHARDHKDSLMETELPERKRKMGSTRKNTGRFKVERKLDDLRTTEELDEEYVTQPNTSTTEEQHSSLTEAEQSSFPSDLSLQTKSSGLVKEPGTTLMFAVSENEEKDAIHCQKITSRSREVVSDMPIDEAKRPSVHSIAVTVAESDLLREDSVMFDEPKTLSHQETPIASTSGLKRRMGSTRRPLGGKNSENVGVQEHMTENERKAEVMGEAKLKMSEEMAQTWDDVARDDPSSHTESALVLNQSLLADRAELKESDVSAGTETTNQSVAFPLVDSEKPLTEMSNHHGTPLLNEALDFKFGAHTEDLDVLNKVLKEAGSHLSDNSQHVPDTRKDTNASCNFRDVNTEAKEEVLKQKEEPELEELVLHDQESSLSQHDIATLGNSYDCSMAQLIVGGSRSFDMPLSNISHAESTTTSLPHDMSDAVVERQEIHMEMKQENNICNVASVTCDTLTDLESITEEDEDPHILATRENETMSDERGSETEYAFEMTDQGDVRHHNVTQIIMDVRDNEKDGETSAETICISHQKLCDVSAEIEELYKGHEHYSSNISLTHSLRQNDAGKMLENEVRKDKNENENTAVNDVTSKSEEMFSFEDSATDTGSHAHQQLFMQSPDKESNDLHENVNDKAEKEGILFSVESENAAFDRVNGRSEGTEGIKEMDAAPVLTLYVRDADLHLETEAQNKTFDSTNSEAEENINRASVLVRENKFIGKTVESNMTTESDFLHTSPDAHMEALNVSENPEKEVSGVTETVLKQSDINIVTEDSHAEEAHAKSSPVVHKRKMGSTRRPLKGNKGQRKDHDEKEMFNLEDEPCPDESRYTAVSICDISESQTLTKIHAESQENTGDVEIVPAEGDTQSHSENKMFDSTAFEGEVEVRKVEVIGRTVTVESNMTSDSDFLETSPDAHMEALNVSKNAEKKVSEETNTIPEQSDISIIPADSHREEKHPMSSPVIQKRKMGSTRRPLKGNKGQRKDHDEKEIFDLEDEPCPDESRYTAVSICDISESQTLTKIHAGSQENTGDLEIAPAGGDKQSHSENKTFNSTEFEDGERKTTKRVDMSVQELCDDLELEQRSDVSQTQTAPPQNDTGSHLLEFSERTADFVTDSSSLSDVVVPTQIHVSANDVPQTEVAEMNPVSKKSMQKRKMGSTRKRGKRMVNEEEVEEEKEGEAENTTIDDETTKLEEKLILEEAITGSPVHQQLFSSSADKEGHDIEDIVCKSDVQTENSKQNDLNSTINPELLTESECSSNVAAEMFSDLPLGDADTYLDHLHSSGPTVPETPENTLQICDTQLVNADVTKHPQSETVSIEKRRKMGSTRKNFRDGRLRGKRDGAEDTETEDTNAQMSQDSEMSLVREDVDQQTTHNSEDSLLSEIQRALNKTSQSSLSCDWELIVKEPNPDDLANAPDLNMPENSEIKSLQPTPSAHSEPNSPGGQRRKMGSTRKNPRQQLKAEKEDEGKEDGEIDENSKTNKQEKKDLERVEVSVVHNITENKLNKEYLDVSSAHTSSSQQEESTNPVNQEKTSPSTKRKFGSRRANKGKQGLGRLAASDFGNELADGDHKPDSSEFKDKLHSDDLAACHNLPPENQPVSEQRNMEAKNEEAASKGTGAGLASLDQIIKHDRSTGAKQTVNLKNRISDTEVVQFNVVMVGNSCVGKTSFIRRFHEGQFTEDYRSTIGVDTCIQTVVLPDRIVKLQIWDTAGQERFHSITTQVFHKADGLLLMYEITCSKSFISVRDWISQARERAPDDVIMMLLGNKNDSVKREVQIQEGADLAREDNIHFMECSAATGDNVSESMRSLAELLVQRKSQREKHTTLRREPPQKKSGCC